MHIGTVVLVILHEVIKNPNFSPNSTHLGAFSMCHICRTSSPTAFSYTFQGPDLMGQAYMVSRPPSGNVINNIPEAKQLGFKVEIGPIFMH